MPQGSAIPPDQYYVELAAYGFSVEIPNAEWSARMADALRTNYGFSDQEVRWFTMHAALDAEHCDEFRKHAHEVAESPGGLDALRDKSLAMAELVKRAGEERVERPRHVERRRGLRSTTSSSNSSAKRPSPDGRGLDCRPRTGAGRGWVWCADAWS